MSANGLHRIRWRRVAVARVHFARDLVNMQQSIVEEGVENVGLKERGIEVECNVS